MGRLNTRSGPEANGYRVEAPRASDAIGRSLREAYDRDNGLPEDMAALLRKLNGADGMSSAR